MQTASAYSMVFPVVGGVQDGDQVNIRAVHGTAFSVGGDVFLTASHVMPYAREHPWAGLEIRNEGEHSGAVPVIEVDDHPEYDVCLIRARVPDPMVLRWTVGPLPMGAGVRACGYPYSVDADLGRLTVRTFMGGIVSAGGRWQRLTAKPDVYELQFPCPRGLSGAPLLLNAPEFAVVAGVVIGSRATQVQVLTERDTTEDGKGNVVVEKFDTLHLGIAVDSRAILGIESALVGGTLEKHLARQRLLGLTR